MAAKKSTKEMLAARNPLARASVEPVDIYSIVPPVSEPVAEAKPAVKQAKKPATSKTQGKTTGSRATQALKTADLEADPVSPYSTYLRKSQVKAIKFRAIERDVKDQNIVQEAIDEYFRRHTE